MNVTLLRRVEMGNAYRILVGTLDHLGDPSVWGGGESI
jgi:hypothetical protein